NVLQREMATTDQRIAELSATVQEENRVLHQKTDALHGNAVIVNQQLDQAFAAVTNQIKALQEEITNLQNRHQFQATAEDESEGGFYERLGNDFLSSARWARERNQRATTQPPEQEGQGNVDAEMREAPAGSGQGNGNGQGRPNDFPSGDNVGNTAGGQGGGLPPPPRNPVVGAGGDPGGDSDGSSDQSSEEDRSYRGRYRASSTPAFLQGGNDGIAVIRTVAPLK